MLEHEENLDINSEEDKSTTNSDKFRENIAEIGEKLRNTLRTIAFRIVKDVEEADLLASEAMEKTIAAYKKSPSEHSMILEKPKLAAYLKMVVKNLALNQLRSKKRRIGKDVESEVYLPILPQNSEKLLHIQRICALLAEAIAELPKEEYKELVRGKYYEGLSAEELAEKHKLTPTIIYSHIKCTKKHLRAIIEGNPKYSPLIEEIIQD